MRYFNEITKELHVCLIDLQEGCVLGSRKKVLGSWQKTRDTGNPSLPVIAFSHFQVRVLEGLFDRH